jgi:hypothetical protein
MEKKFTEKTTPFFSFGTNLGDLFVGVAHAESASQYTVGVLTVLNLHENPRFWRHSEQHRLKHTLTVVVNHKEVFYH